MHDAGRAELEAVWRVVGHHSSREEENSSLGHVCKQNMLAQCPTSITIACGHRSLLRAIDRAEDHSAFATATCGAQQHPEEAKAHLDIPVHTGQHAYGDLHVAAVGKGLQLGHGGLLRRGESVGIHASEASRASEQFEASICRIAK